MKTISIRSINPVRHSLRRSPRRDGFLLVPLACTLLALALSPPARAACQQGCDIGYGNTYLGDDALISNTTGYGDTAIGLLALNNNTTGYFNTATGAGALQANTTGNNNTANGLNALYTNTTGENNTANGTDALYSNSTGGTNTATGFDALYNNTTGANNTANGVNALLSNTTGYNNTANGAFALSFNTTGYYNTANGLDALYNNTTGSDNLANGYQALFANTTGLQNTADGDGALIANTTGRSNIALGYLAGGNLTTGSNNIDIGNAGVAAESKTIRIGTKATHRATYVAGISGATVPTGIAVIIDANGHLGTTTSSARYKDNIRPMDKSSEALLNLQPVTFHYKKELDPQAIPQFGLVAEEVAKVNPDLVARDDEGKPYTVRYEAVNAMLLNEFLKEHRKVEEQTSLNRQQDATISTLQSALAQEQSANAEQKKEIEALKTALKEQAAQIQKVSAQIAARRPAPRVADNH